MRTDSLGSVTPVPTTTSDETIAVVADLIGDKWSMLVLRDVFRGVRRFDGLCADLGMSRAVLTERLKRLVDAGVLTRVPYQERPVRYEYRLTPMGVELSPMLVALMRWGDRWLGAARPQPGWSTPRAAPICNRPSGAPPASAPSDQVPSARPEQRGRQLRLTDRARAHPTPYGFARRGDVSHRGSTEPMSFTSGGTHCRGEMGRSRPSALTE